MGAVKISHAELVATLKYEPATGFFIWKLTCGSRAVKGTVAGSYRGDGYIGIRLNGDLYYAHILAWFYVNKVWPTHEIDHKDRNPSNNRWSNLIPVYSRKEQLNNTKSINKHGEFYRGVNWSPKLQQFRVFHRCKFVGHYLDLISAVAAKKQKEREEGYSDFFKGTS